MGGRKEVKGGREQRREREREGRGEVPSVKNEGSACERTRELKLRRTVWIGPRREGSEAGRDSGRQGYENASSRSGLS